MYQDYESQDFYLTNVDYKQQINPRLGFIRKVYGIISFQLLITTIFVILCQGPLRTFLYNPYSTTQGLPFALFITCAVITLICAIMIGCCRSIATKVPTNYIVLTIFTLAESYIVGYFTVFFEPEDVILAAVLTLSMTIALTLYACTTKRDVTMCGAALWIGGWALLACGILFFGMTRGTVAYKPAVIGISVVSIMFYGFYLIYDTQLIMGGKRYQLGLDDYIIAAIAVYMDIVVLFIRILRIIGMARRR